MYHKQNKNYEVPDFPKLKKPKLKTQTKIKIGRALNKFKFPNNYW